ncbi:hypothetical protein D1122_08990 [Cereibacter sphaeroides]|nr:hypothetical protein D1122_08990 [Cereibacter sphaeroides]
MVEAAARWSVPQKVVFRGALSQKGGSGFEDRFPLEVQATRTIPAVPEAATPVMKAPQTMTIELLPLLAGRSPAVPERAFLVSSPRAAVILGEEALP